MGILIEPLDNGPYCKLSLSGEFMGTILADGKIVIIGKRESFVELGNRLAGL